MDGLALFYGLMWLAIFWGGGGIVLGTLSILPFWLFARRFTHEFNLGVVVVFGYILPLILFPVILFTDTGGGLNAIGGTIITATAQILYIGVVGVYAYVGFKHKFFAISITLVAILVVVIGGNIFRERFLGKGCVIHHGGYVYCKVGDPELEPFNAMFSVDRAKIGLTPIPSNGNATIYFYRGKLAKQYGHDAHVAIHGSSFVKRFLFVCDGESYVLIKESETHSPLNPSEGYIGLSYLFDDQVESQAKLSISVWGDFSALAGKQHSALTLEDVRPLIEEWQETRRTSPTKEL